MAIHFMGSTFLKTAWVADFVVSEVSVYYCWDLDRFCD